jgi:hypothetical protein
MDQKELKNSIFARMAGQKSNEGNTSSYNNINQLQMDSKAILKNIMTMLGVEKNVELGGNANAGGPFYGKLEDGSPVMSDYFDLGHTLIVIKEDGSKVAAPDADHIIYLPIGLAGGQKRYFITTKDGIITSMNLEDNYGAKKTNVNFAVEEKSTEMEKDMKKDMEKDMEKKLAEDSVQVKDEKDAVKKEEKMQDEASRLDSLEEQLGQLRVDIAQLFEAMKDKKEEMSVEVRDEEEAVKRLQEKDQLQGKPNDGGPQKMSAAKKFTGAPVEEKVNLGGLVKSNKLGTTMGSVLTRINNSKF